MSPRSLRERISASRYYRPGNLLILGLLIAYSTKTFFDTPDFATRLIVVFLFRVGIAFTAGSVIVIVVVLIGYVVDAKTFAHNRIWYDFFGIGPKIKK